jgi:dienelactone hydrolase
VPQDLHYEADGLAMCGSLHLPAGEQPAPAVLVFPHAFGLDVHAIGKAERIASDLGYVALACDLHGNRQTIGMDQVATALGPLRTDAERVRARTSAALRALLTRPEVDPNRVAAIGFCFGGTMCFELALSGADIKAAIGFHSGLKVMSPQNASQIKGRVLALLGADDPGVPPEDRTAFAATLTEGKVDWQMTLYGGVVHSFTNTDAEHLNMPQFARYDARADRRSWEQMAALMAEAFGG